MQFKKLVEQLGLADLYPHPVEVITTIETHISIVFLTGQYAYKLKKPVNFGFLDFSTIEKRREFCELEVQLNKRTAPQLYLGVVPLFQNELKLSLIPESGDQQPIEFLVKMKQFDPNNILSRYLKHSDLDQTQITHLAKQIANFHAQAESIDPNEIYGDPDNLIQPMLDNFPSLLDTYSHPELQYRLKHLREWTLFTQKQLYDVLIERKHHGFVKACHGDMHLDNVALVDDTPTLFDGIEFNNQFRWIDTISDLAFLLIDIDFRQQFTLKRQLLSLYMRYTGDYEALKLLRFYQTYRTMVRAKISALRYHQLESGSAEAKLLWDKALQYLQQAENYAYELPQPKIILMQGVAGSGKSYYAHLILEHFDALIVSSDIERKRLYGIDPLHRVEEHEKADLYSAEMNEKTYSRLFELTEEIIHEGYTVIVDATFLKFEHRSVFMELAEKLRVPYRLVSIEPDPFVIQQNITDRQLANNNPSDADLNIMQRQLASLEPPRPFEKAYSIQPRTSLDIEQFKNWLEQPL